MTLTQQNQIQDFSDFNRFLSIPYADKGRDYSGADCYGILYLIYKENGIILPSYTSDYENSGNSKSAGLAIAQNSQKWQKIEEAQIKLFDVVLFKICGFPCHLGVIIDSKEKMMIHTLKGQNTSIEKYSRVMWQKRIEGFYRYDDCILSKEYILQRSSAD